MARTSQPRIARRPKRGRNAPSETPKHPVIDNRSYPSTEEVGRLLNVPAGRVRELKDLAAEKLKIVELGQ